MLTELCKQPWNYTIPSARKKQGNEKATMKGLRELSKNVSQDSRKIWCQSWTKEAIYTPTVPRKPKVTFSDNVTVLPANPAPRRATREVANLDPTTVVGNNGSPARDTRAKFAVAAAALAAIMSNNQAGAKQWEHRKHSPMAHKLELNEVAYAVLEGDTIDNWYST